MSVSNVVEHESEVRPHILEPFLSFEEVEDPAEAATSRLLQEAFERGAAEGRKAAEAELSSAVQAMAAGARELSAYRNAAQEQMERDVVMLSLAIARRVVMHEISTRPEVIVEIVRQLTEEAEDHKVSAVRLNPADLERVRASQAAATLQESGVALQPSEEVREGGCILETGFGRLDARMETRLEEITSALLGSGKTAEGTAS